MNNLLRALTESRVKAQFPDHDFKQLLSSVKDGRGQENKLSDPFYDSLEGLLTDLKTITIDNHDADAFLKPVVRAEVPDYYEVISHPMDFQTMLKKVKSKSYRSKREFKDDLDLIWSNCLTYNATESHPLRACVKRLQIKAERLLKHITDRKERTDPAIPPEFAPSTNKVHTIKLNGHTNGLVNGHSNGTPASPRITLFPPNSRPGSSTPKLGAATPTAKSASRPVSWADRPALVRTQEGMSTFMELSHLMDTYTSSQASTSTSTASPLMDRLREFAALGTDMDVDEEEVEIKEEADDVTSTLGSKRRLKTPHEGSRPRKRVRMNSQHPIPIPPDDDPITQLWWGAVQSDSLFNNALPPIPFPSSSHVARHVFPDASVRKKRKKKDKDVQSTLEKKEKDRTMLGLMNSNIRTMRRVRHTHAKFQALGFIGGGYDEDEGTALGGPSVPAIPPMPLVNGAPVWDEDALGLEDDRIDERKWRLNKGKGRAHAEREGVDVTSGVEMGLENATDCVQWMSNKVLEHAGFQGTSTVALEVLTGVAAEYLMNVGRTIRYLSDKHRETMTPEEIILHTLFESGISKVEDLERYAQDDVERYGSRLGDLEKKLVGAYRDTVGKMDSSVTAMEDADEGLFEEEEDEDETNPLARGEFADDTGVDFFGFKEMGIMEEFGLASLTIPRSLLKGRKKRLRPSVVIAPKEPPLPFPPPPAFLPLTVSMVEDQIGLLKPYYHNRLNVLRPPPAIVAPSLHLPPLPSLNPYPSIPSAPAAPPAYTIPAAPPNLYSNPYQQAYSSSYQATPTPTIHTMSPLLPPPPAQQQPVIAPLPPDLVLPDDQPSAAQVKMGPVGQIIKTFPGATSSKKKAKAAAAAAAAANAVNTSVSPTAMKMELSVNGNANGFLSPGGASSLGTPSPKKKKGATGVGTGNGRKKKLGDQQSPQPMILPIVTASA